MHIGASPLLTIDLSAIAANYRLLRQKAGPAECGAVVKANAYGLGVEPVAKRLYQEGCRTFFVATLEEAIELRAILPQPLIAVFNGLLPGEEKEYLQHKLTPVLNDLGQLHRWIKVLEETRDAPPPIIHIDTGMNRLGCNMKEATYITEHYVQAGYPVCAVMSHLACADEPEHPKNQEQLEKLEQLRWYFKGQRFSFANSSGIFLDKAYHGDLVRPGSSLYGINPMIEGVNPMHNVVTVTAPIISLRTLDSSATIGYGATFTAEPGRVLATIPVGYADGYLRSLSNKAWGAINGKRVPVVGRVSMDLVILDVTSAMPVHLGDEVELIGDNITLEEVAGWAGTIEYEILTNLGSRYRRMYTS